jgi:hypothetical protein
MGEYLTKRVSIVLPSYYYYSGVSTAMPHLELELANSESERLRCAACHRDIPIPNPTIDSGHYQIWWLAHCRHPLHLDCLAPLGRPNAISRVTQRPYYVHDPGFSYPLFMSLMLTI